MQRWQVISDEVQPADRHAQLPALFYPQVASMGHIPNGQDGIRRSSRRISLVKGPDFATPHVFLELGKDIVSGAVYPRRNNARSVRARDGHGTELTTYDIPDQTLCVLDDWICVGRHGGGKQEGRRAFDMQSHTPSYAT